MRSPLLSLPADPAPCPSTRVIHTLGHSTRSFPEFLSLLEEHAIEWVVDVRRWPHSTRYPHFCRTTLELALSEKGFRYLWKADLGGFRQPRADSPNRAWQTPGFRGYADFMLEKTFKHSLGELELLAWCGRVCLICAEAHYWRCHRRLLSDALLVRGWTVRHILQKGSPCQPHRLPPFAVYQNGQLTYPGTSV